MILKIKDLESQSQRAVQILSSAAACYACADAHMERWISGCLERYGSSFWVA